MPTVPKRWRSDVAPKAAIVTILVFAGSVTACGSDDHRERIPDADHVAVCVDEKTMERRPDDECDEDDHRTGGRGGWFFIPMGNRGSTTQAPAVGSRVTTGTFTPPPGAKVARGGIPSQGGAVVRGGFGGVKGSGSVGG